MSAVFSLSLIYYFYCRVDCFCTYFFCFFCCKYITLMCIIAAVVHASIPMDYMEDRPRKIVRLDVEN
jgi:hypothetical protein